MALSTFTILNSAAPSKKEADKQNSSVSKGLDPKDYKSFQVSNVEIFNHNSKIYTIKASGQDHLPVSSFVLAKAPIGPDGKDVQRPYTPITPLTKDELRLLIKTYPEGKMSQHFDSLKPGDQIELKGPLPKLAYKANTKTEIVPSSY